MCTGQIQNFILQIYMDICKAIVCRRPKSMFCKLTKTFYYHKIFWLMKYVVTYIETLAMLLINLSIYVVLKLYRVYITLLVINYLRGGDTHIRMHAHTHTHKHTSICGQKPGTLVRTWFEKHIHYLSTSNSSTVEPVYYGHLGTNQKCPDYQDFLIFQVR